MYFEGQYPICRYAIRTLGNLQCFNLAVAEAFFAARRDVGVVYAETHAAVGKFNTFGPGSLERLA